MGIRDLIKKNVRLIVFILLLVVVPTVLFFNRDTSSKGYTTTVTQPPQPEVDIGEGEDEGEDGESVEGAIPNQPTLPLEDFTEEEPVEEKRVSFLEDGVESIDDHQRIVSNEKFDLYFQEETLSIIVRSRDTGSLMYSTVKEPVESNDKWQNFVRSGIVMEYLVGTNVVYSQADMYTENTTKDIEIVEDGFIATIEHGDLGIRYEVQGILTSEGFEVKIPQDKIVETNDRFRIANFYIYPFMGYTQTDETEGYMFIPDGSGALIHLDNNQGKYKQPYSEMVYGPNAGIDEPYVLSLFKGLNPINEAQKILAPVFGMVHTSDQMGYLGIIKGGDVSAKIEAYPNGAILPYNWITSKFIYRQFYNQQTSADTGTMVVRQEEKNDFDIDVLYQFVTEDDADYFGLAKSYQNYLLDNHLIQEKQDEFNVRIDFLGSEVKNGLIFKSNVPMTTFEQAKEILEELEEENINNILATYRGWQNKGATGGLPIQNVSMNGSLGDKTILEEYLEGNEDIKLYFYENALLFNPDENMSTSYDLARKYNRRLLENKVYGKVYNSFNYVTADQSAKILYSKLTDYQDANITNIVIGGITNELFAYRFGNKLYDRSYAAKRYSEIIGKYGSEVSIALEQPFALYWNQSNIIMDVPINSSDFVYTDEDIPFISLVLKGITPMYSEYVNFESNKDEFFLSLVEQGIYPSFLITYESPEELQDTNSSEIYTSQFTRYKEEISRYYQELSELQEYTTGAKIISHVRENDVVKVSYENEVVVYVNYNDFEVEIEGKVIDALSYKVVM